MEAQNLYLLIAALAIGLLIGVERGWQAREAKEGELNCRPSDLCTNRAFRWCHRDHD